MYRNVLKLLNMKIFQKQKSHQVAVVIRVFFFFYYRWFCNFHHNIFTWDETGEKNGPKQQFPSLKLYFYIRFSFFICKTPDRLVSTCPCLYPTDMVYFLPFCLLKMDHRGLCIESHSSNKTKNKTAPTLSSFITVFDVLLLHDNISSSGVGEWPRIGLSSGPVISPWLTPARSWREKLKRHHWMMWHRVKKILTKKLTFLIGFSSVSFLFSPSVNRSTPSPPRWKSNKSADIDPVAPASPILFQPERDGYLQKSWQTIVFTIFFLRANKGGAVIASDYMKNHLMIPIYNSRLNNDTVKSWQAVINEGSYKTYLVWRLAGDELHSDTNSW